MYILSYFIFRFDANHPGKVFVRCVPDSAEEQFTLLSSSSPLPTTGPNPVKPPGLDLKRQWYLYNNIRPFVKEECKDTL